MIEKLKLYNESLVTEELTKLKGDSSKARKALEWKPKFDFKGLVEDMAAYWKELA